MWNGGGQDDRLNRGGGGGKEGRGAVWLLCDGVLREFFDTVILTVE